LEQQRHHYDVPLADIVDIKSAGRPASISFKPANPRHAHQWYLFETVKLPESKIVIPGVIESKSNFIEHPELIADRISNNGKINRTGEPNRRQWLRRKLASDKPRSILTSSGRK
jgi:hypothetical protein